MPFYDGHAVVSRLTSPKSTESSKSRSDNNEGVRVSDAYLGDNVRVANRHIVITNLLKSLKFESKISCFDINLPMQLILLAVGRMVYVVNLETNILKAEMGKSGGSCHKEEIRGCAMDLAGKLGATCGEDKRIIVWDLNHYKASKVLEGHAGALHAVEFTTDSERLISSSDDGRVNVWDWRSGNIILSTIRHSSAVRCFDFNYSQPNLLVCGCNDGHITVWNTAEGIKIDDILPETELMALDNTFQTSLDEHHSGSILSIKLSLDKNLMATTSNDTTCKIWKVSSYMKDINEVKKSAQEMEATRNRMNGCIDVLDETLNDQLVINDTQTLKIGELHLYSGYHADLKFTLSHDAPVLSVSFTKNSDLVVTGALDSTIRIWSSRRGEPLFQINVPDPVPQIKMDYKDNLYCSCSNRILVFNIKPLFKEAEVPNFWKRSEMKKKLLQAGNEAGEKEKSNEASIPLSELRKLIAHGVVLPDTIEQIGSVLPDIDMKQLIANMKKFNIFPQQILRLIAQSKFLPRDILKVLSSKNPQIVMALLSQGASINTFMIQRGYKAINTEEDPFVTINWKNLASPDQIITKRKKTDFNYHEWWKEHFRIEAEDLLSEDEDEFFWLNDRPRDYQAPKGRIVHFIPSEHMKILKDLSSNKDVKPIFLRSLAAQKAMYEQEQLLFPNFRPSDIIDNRPVLEKSKNPPSKPLRFNEDFSSGGTHSKHKQKSKGIGNRLRNFARPDLLESVVSPHLLRTMELHGNLLAEERSGKPRKLQPKPKWKRLESHNYSQDQDLDSSNQVLKPNKYLQTRGLDVHFESGPSTSNGTDRRNSYGDIIDKMIDRIFTTPLMFSENSHKERYAVPVSERTAFQNDLAITPRSDRNEKPPSSLRGKATAPSNSNHDN